MIPSSTTSAVMANGEGKRCWQSPSLIAHPSPKPQLVTFVPLAVTPASAVSPSGPSSTTTANTSMQSSPEGPRGRNLPHSSSPTPLQLPESTSKIPVPANPSVMNEAITPNKGPSLIRRLSKGAAKKVMGRRPSSNHINNRDRSSGPVIKRRNSESRSSAETEAGIIESGLGGYDDEDTLEDIVPLNGLGLSGDGISCENGGSAMVRSRTQGGITPIVPWQLRQSTTLSKVTKKKRKTLVFVLDTDSAKVSWHPTDGSKKFYIDDIQQIRLQSDARNYREEFQISADEEPRWFTIVYADQNRAKGRPVKTIHLIAPDALTFELWTSTLNDLSKYRHDLMAGLAGSRQDEKILRGHWKREMAKLWGDSPHADDEENLGLDGVKDLCLSLHIHASENLLRAHFDKADTCGTGCLSFHEFKDFIRRLKHRTDIKDICKTLNTESTDGLDQEQFLGFLQRSQGVDVEANRAQWIKVFAKFARRPDSSLRITRDISDESSTRMDCEALSSFLCSSYNSVQAAKPSEPKLDRPLNEYYISSSHNTYLLGRQFAGSSSTEAYIRALQRACRCVEIDCWDGPDGLPIVLHGRTMTKSVSFAKCVSVIGEYAFVSSPYPLMLSLEVHCNADQQQVMVDIMIKELGERLLREPLMTNVFNLPSPDDLRHKILVKVKAGSDPNLNKDQPRGLRQRSFSSPFSRPQVLDNSTIPTGPLLSSPPSIGRSEHSSTWAAGRGSMTAVSMSSATDDSDATPGGSLGARRRPSKQKSKIIKSLGDLGVYTRGLKYKNFALPESKAYNHVFSLAERHFEGLCRTPEIKEQLEKHNMRYLMRVYPSGFRLKSSNPDPLAFWRRGAQMVALNWQTYDLGMQMNQAMFASGSDQTGYVLKPRELRQSRSLEEHTWEDACPGVGRIRKKLIRFSVDTISAQQLPWPRGVRWDETLNPYIEIEMFSAEDKATGVAFGEGGQDASPRNGMSGIGSPHRRRSHVVPSNGYNPIFNDNFKLSLETKYPSLVFVRWTVWNSQDGRTYNTNANADPLATFTAKLSSIEQGYRHLPLYDHNGDQFLFATLFCKITKEEPVTIERDDPVAEKIGRFRQFSQSVFKRSLSTDKKPSRELKGKASSDLSRKSSSEMNGKISTERIPTEAIGRVAMDLNGKLPTDA